MEEMEARRIVDSYADMILRISSAYVKSRREAQDICQTVFLKYLTAGKEFDSYQDEKAWIIRFLFMRPYISAVQVYRGER